MYSSVGVVLNIYVQIRRLLSQCIQELELVYKVFPSSDNTSHMNMYIFRFQN